MLFVNRKARKLNLAGPSSRYFQPRCEGLEDKILMITDLGGSVAGANPTIANAPFGMDFAGGTIAGASTVLASKAAGQAVADVGDLNGDGFEDFAIASPGASPGVFGTSYVSVIFGSNQTQNPPAQPVVASTQNWIGIKTTTPLVYNYAANDRVGDLSQLSITGIATPPPVQTNPAVSMPNANPPVTVPLTFPFAGVTFYASDLNLAGASAVAGVNIGGRQGLLIGAQNAPSSGGSLGTGRAYLIFGNFNAFAGQTINLDTPTIYTGLTIIQFVSSAAGSRLGASVAGGVNILGSGSSESDIILGAPTATVDGQVNTGAVYVIPTSSISGLTSASPPVDVTTVGQPGGVAGLVFAGVNSGDQAGFSVADAGNVNGAASGAHDLLIGAPQSGSGAGNAYLVYGGSNLAGLATTTGGVSFINLARVGTTVTSPVPVPGAIFTGPGNGALNGFSVSSAGDWNGDGFSDIIIGAPGAGTTSSLNQGVVYVFYGAPNTSSGFLTGTIPVGNIPATFGSATLVGANAGDMAGSSVSLVGTINPGQPNEILIGAPGFNSSAGTAYLLPGRTGTGLRGVFSLGAAEGSILAGNQYVLTTPSSPAGTPNLFGTSVSGRLQTTANTADADNRGDFIIGDPGYDVTQDNTRLNAGGAQVVEGGLIKLSTPTSGVITTIGVGKAPPPPFQINNTTPANLQIFVQASLTTPSFRPVTDINPATVVVNGVPFPTATIATDTNTGDNVNGIPTAIITINPVSALNLPVGLDTITISGQMLPSSPLFGQTWTGTAQVTVTGGPTPPPFFGVAGVPSGPNLLTNFVPPFGANQYTPSLTNLSTFNYQPIPVSVALEQFLPPQGFRQRIYSYNHPGKTIGPFLTNRGQNTGRALNVFTLSSKVFDRSRFHGQRNYNYTHKGPKVGLLKGVIPTQGTRAHYDDNLIT